MTKDIMVNVSTQEVEDMNIGFIEDTDIEDIDAVEIGEFNDAIDTLDEVFDGFSAMALQDLVEVESIDGWFNAISGAIAKVNHAVSRVVRTQMKVANKVINNVAHGKSPTHGIPINKFSRKAKPFILHVVEKTANAASNIAHAISRNPIAAVTPLSVAAKVVAKVADDQKKIVKTLIKNKAKKVYHAMKEKEGEKTAKRNFMERVFPVYKKALNHAYKTIEEKKHKAFATLRRNPHAAEVIARPVLGTVKMPVPMPFIPHPVTVSIPKAIPTVHIPTVHHTYPRPTVHPAVHHKVSKTTKIINTFPPHVRYALKTIQARFRMAHTPQEKAKLKKIASGVAGKLLIDVVKKPALFNYKYSNLKKQEWIKHAYHAAPKDVKKIFISEAKKLREEEKKREAKDATAKATFLLYKEGKITPEQYRNFQLRQRVRSYEKFIPPKTQHELLTEAYKRKKYEEAKKRKLLEYKEKLLKTKNEIEMEKKKLEIAKIKFMRDLKKLEQEKKLMQNKLNYWKKRLEKDMAKEKAKYYHTLYKQKLQLIEQEKKRAEQEVKKQREQYIFKLRAKVAELKREKGNLERELKRLKRETSRIKIETHKTPKSMSNPTALDIVKNTIFSIGDNGISEGEDDGIEYVTFGEE